MNRVILIGRIAGDIRSFATPSGINYCRATIAVNRRSTSVEPVTDFIPVVAWRGNADYMSKYLSKGALVSVEGSFTTGQYNNANGETVRTYEVTIDFISSLESREQRARREGAQANPTSSYIPKQPKFTGSTTPVVNEPSFTHNQEVKPSAPQHNFVMDPFEDDDDL
ncbi:single-stranded DNA-binding protein [Mycoplasma simbae]|uniref:single-stranded DNA-binding protein n=1 Tax=Mycoplasma simbae TaxID=36744 RepID=UPI00068F9FEE|nr:single-stranded DNA-binding protein [Mycoplasma simbae]